MKSKHLTDDGPPVPAVGYCRVSTEKQAMMGKSMEAQKKMIAQYCGFAGLDLIGCVEEPGVSAGKKISQRPGLMHVLDMVEDGEVGAVVVIKLDRMFRSVVDASVVLETLRDADVGFHSVVERWDTSTAMGAFQVQIVTAFAEMERRMTGERTKAVMHATKKVRREDLPPTATAAMRYYARTGKLPVGNPPYGYAWIEPKIRAAREIMDTAEVSRLEALKAKYGELIPVPAELKAVRFIKRRRKDAKSMRQVTQWLDLYGYKTRKGTSWNRSQVYRILNRGF